MFFDRLLGSLRYVYNMIDVFMIIILIIMIMIIILILLFERKPDFKKVVQAL